ncbi:flagellar biosynthesis protein FlgA [Dermabacteraceae bacterium TAE3-ERU27]|nr:flagellar biosynthesis protein FlgA [Dermabacteraceae bacterium TAE3-ERU27]
MGSFHKSTLAKRLTPPGWRDPRLLVGVALVLVSIIGGVFYARQVASTIPVLVASRQLAVGEQAGAESFVVREMRLADSANNYFADYGDLPEGAILAVPVGPGELLPRSALVTPELLNLRPVAVRVDGPVAESVRKGARVELWHSQEGEAGARRLVENASVSNVSLAQGIGARGATVEVMLPQAQLPEVLTALAGKGRVDVIAVPGNAKEKP